VTRTRNTEVFVYTGSGGDNVPQDVVRVWVDASVTSIPAEAFIRRKKLAEVELCEGLVEIGERSFACCDHSITTINIPNSLRRIRNRAFSYSLRCPICLHDGIESIGTNAFGSCIFTNFRVPPLITAIPMEMLQYCQSVFSVELPENSIEIRVRAFSYCCSLRNVAFPPNAIIDDNVLVGVNTMDLNQLFNSSKRIIWELQHRFDKLPVHSVVYYQSYHQRVLQRLLAATNSVSCQRRTFRGKLDPTVSQQDCYLQDCLGMTPLHILACSSVHDLELYRVIVEKYPTTLITEDKWGALPLLYAFWGAAPAEIIQFLLESYQSLYPSHAFKWTMMVETIGRCESPNVLRTFYV
jgi:hypothetical protein